jgi:hypothetical protein
MGLWSVEELVYTYIFWHVESVKQAVNILDALVHPIRTGEALGDRAVQVEDNAAHAQGRTPTESDYVLSLLGELTGANQFSGGVHGVNVAEERLTSGWERFEDITVGGAQIVSAASSTSASLLRFSQSFAANSVQKVATRSPKSASTRNQPDCTPPAAAENSVVPTTPMVDRIRKVAQQGYDYAVPHPRRQGLNRMELGKDAEVQATRWTRRWAERSGVSLESDGLRFQVRGANSIPDIVFSPARKIFDFKLTPAAVRSSQTRNFRVDFPGHDIEYIFGP